MQEEQAVITFRRVLIEYSFIEGRFFKVHINIISIYNGAKVAFMGKKVFCNYWDIRTIVS